MGFWSRRGKHTELKSLDTLGVRTRSISVKHFDTDQADGFRYPESPTANRSCNMASVAILIGINIVRKVRSECCTVLELRVGSQNTGVDNIGGNTLSSCAVENV